MNIACSICLESFTLTCNIYTTPCGHVYHYECILKWLESGNSHCSQCRKSCVTNQIFKLYFSENDLALQENTISGFSAQLITQLKSDNRKLQQEVNRIKARESKAEKKCVELKNENLNLSIMYHQSRSQCGGLERVLKEQREDLNDKHENIEKLQQEVNKSKARELEAEKKCVELQNEKSNLSIMYHQSRSKCGEMERVLKKQREDLNDKNEKIEKFENTINNLKLGDKNHLGIPIDLCRKSLHGQFSRNHLQGQLHEAVVKSNFEDCKVILTQINERVGDTNTGDTALHDAALFGVPKTFKLILDFSDNKNPRNIIGKTPLHLAAEWGHAEICQIILPLVNEKNPGDHWGSTPLHYAAKWGHLKICEMILAEVSNKNPINNLDETVFSVAKKAGNDAICQLIKTALMENEFQTPVLAPKMLRISTEGAHNPEELGKYNYYRQAKGRERDPGLTSSPNPRTNNEQFRTKSVKKKCKKVGMPA